MNTEAGAELSLSHVLRPEIAADPYPLYHRLRSEDPVRWDAPLNAWVVTRYADVQSALGDARLSGGAYQSVDGMAAGGDAADPGAGLPRPLTADAVPGPTGSHAAARDRQQSVHPARGGRDASAHPGDRRRPAGRGSGGEPDGRHPGLRL